MPWKHVYRNKKEIKTERSLVLMLGGSLYEDGYNVRITNRRRRGDEHTLTKKGIHLDEHLYQRDFSVITEFFERMNVTIWRCVPPSFRSSRQEAFDLINEFFQLDSKDNIGERKTFILYWNGHGTHGSGNWGFSIGGEITCRDIINAWQSRPLFEQHNDMSSLTIISDTCYSGGWIEELKAERIPRLAYQAASRADEPAFLIDDGNIPRSLLMRKFIIEATYPIDWYVWTCHDQHPVHLCEYAEEENGVDFSAGQRRTLVHGGPYYFFTVDQHWNNNGKLLNKESKSTINALAKYGVFLDDI